MASLTEVGNDLDRFRNDITEFQNALTGFSNAYDKVHEAILSLNGMWEGPAKSALLAVFEQDNEMLREMIGNLNKIYDMYNEAHTEYSKCETSVAELIASMTVGEV